MTKIFISYRRSDASDMASRIYNNLSTQSPEDSDDIFYDVESLLAGDWKQDITDRIQESEVMLVLIGKEWLSATDNNGALRLFNLNDVVRFEVEVGLNLSFVTVIPILVNNASMPQKASLPETIEDIVKQNAIRVNDDSFSDDIVRLHKALEFVSHKLSKPKRKNSMNSVKGIFEITNRGISCQLLSSFIILLIAGMALLSAISYIAPEPPDYESMTTVAERNNLNSTRDAILSPDTVIVPDGTFAVAMTGAFELATQLFTAVPTSNLCRIRLNAPTALRESANPESEQLATLTAGTFSAQARTPEIYQFGVWWQVNNDIVGWIMDENVTTITSCESTPIINPR